MNYNIILVHIPAKLLLKDGRTEEGMLIDSDCLNINLPLLMVTENLAVPSLANTAWLVVVSKVSLTTWVATMSKPLLVAVNVPSTQSPWGTDSS